jgi:hypothetical protein
MQGGDGQGRMRLGGGGGRGGLGRGFGVQAPREGFPQHRPPSYDPAAASPVVRGAVMEGWPPESYGERHFGGVYMRVGEHGGLPRFENDSGYHMHLATSHASEPVWRLADRGKFAPETQEHCAYFVCGSPQLTALHNLMGPPESRKADTLSVPSGFGSSRFAVRTESRPIMWNVWNTNLRQLLYGQTPDWEQEHLQLTMLVRTCRPAYS